MIPKKDLGSIPLAVLKSVPVVLRDLIASRTPCTMATHDTKEKTEISFECKKHFMRDIIARLTDNLSAHCLCFRRSKRWRQSPRYDIDENLRQLGACVNTYVSEGRENILTGLGARAATVDLKSSSVFTPSIKQTSAPAAAANCKRVTASSIPKTCAESVRPIIT